jgi:hypothetical protein
MKMPSYPLFCIFFPHIFKVKNVVVAIKVKIMEFFYMQANVSWGEEAPYFGMEPSIA